MISLLFFQQEYPARFEQVWAAAILAVIGGYVACLFTSFNTWVCIVRKKWSKIMWARMLEVRATEGGGEAAASWQPCNQDTHKCELFPPPLNHGQVVIISIVTSFILFLLPTVGNCLPCNTIGADNCIMGKGSGRGSGEQR